MDFRVEHTFRDISLADYETLYWDEEFNIALCENVKLERDLRDRTMTGNRLHREVLVTPDREIPKPVQKILKADRI